MSPETIYRFVNAQTKSLYCAEDNINKYKRRKQDTLLLWR